MRGNSLEAKCKSVLGTEWNCNKLAVNLLVIPDAPVITPHGGG
jgi:hypothetical protein